MDMFNDIQWIIEYKTFPYLFKGNVGKANIGHPYFDGLL